MKRIIFATISLVALSFLNANAAGEETKKEVNLTVKLHLIQSLQVNENQTNVVLEYATKDDYEKGVSVTENDHLTVYSTGGFVITAKSADANFKNAVTGANAKPFATNSVRLTATNAAGSQEAATYTDIPLNSAEANLISSSTGGANRTFNVTYSGAGNNAYLNNYDSKANNPNEYTTVVTYSIIAQ